MTNSTNRTRSDPIYIKLQLLKLKDIYKLQVAIAMYNIFSFQPFPLVRGGYSVSSFFTSFCLQCPSPSHQLPSYLLLPHLKIFSLVSLFSSFYHLSSYMLLVSPHDMSIPPQPALPHLHS